MKNISKNSVDYNTRIFSNRNNFKDIRKTTNINILLNRVKLNKKRDLKKKVIFLTLLAAVIGLVTFFAIF
jgi:hypothetical protein